MKNMTLAAAILLAACAGARTFDVTDYGAKADGKTDNTAAIQKAIDACSAAGGGMVLVPGGGTYMTYTLNLKSNVRLEIDRGATLMGGTDALKYPEFGPSEYWNVDRVPRFNKRALFYTVAQTNVAITGRGTVDGNADSFHEPVPNPKPGQPKFKRKSDTLITGRSALFVAWDALIYVSMVAFSVRSVRSDRVVPVAVVRFTCALKPKDVTPSSIRWPCTSRNVPVILSGTVPVSFRVLVITT